MPSKRIFFALTLFTLFFLSGIANSYANTEFTNLKSEGTSLSLNQLSSEEMDYQEQQEHLQEQISSEKINKKELTELNELNEINKPIVSAEEMVIPPSLLLEEDYLLPLPRASYFWEYSEYEYSSWVSFNVYSNFESINYSDYTFAAALHVGSWSWDSINIDQSELTFNPSEKIATYGFGFKASRLWLDSYNNFAGYSNLQLTVILLTKTHLYFDTTSVNIPSASDEFSEASIDYSWVDNNNDSFVDDIYCTYSTPYIFLGRNTGYYTRYYYLEMIIRDHSTKKEIYRLDFSSDDFNNQTVVNGTTFGNFNTTVPISSLTSQEITDQFEIIFIYSYFINYGVGYWGEDKEGGIWNYSTATTDLLPSSQPVDEIVLSTSLINFTETSSLDLMELELTLDTTLNLSAEWSVSAELILPEGLPVHDLTAVVSIDTVVSIKINLALSFFYRFSTDSLTVKLNLFVNGSIYQIKEFIITKPLENDLYIIPGYISEFLTNLLDKNNNGLYDTIVFTAFFYAFEKTTIGMKAAFPEIDFEFDQSIFSLFEVRKGWNNLSLSINAEIFRKINYIGEIAVSVDLFTIEWNLIDGGLFVMAHVADHAQTFQFSTSQINYHELEYPMISVILFDVNLFRDTTDMIYQIQLDITFNVTAFNMFYIHLDVLNNDTFELISQEYKNRAYSVGYYYQTYLLSGAQLIAFNVSNLKLSFFISLADGSIIEYCEEMVSFDLDNIRASGILNVQMLTEVAVDDDYDGLIDGIRLVFEIEMAYTEEFILYLGLAPSIGYWTVGTSRPFYPSIEKEQVLKPGKTIVFMTIVDNRFAVSYYNDTWDWYFEVRTPLGFAVKELNGTTESYSYTDFDLYPPEINDDLREAKLLIIYPYVGYTISQTVELIWSYVTPFGEDYNFTITITDSSGNETIIATDVQGNRFLWNTQEVKDDTYSMRIEGENVYFSVVDTVKKIIIKNATSETKDDASLNYLFIIELLVITSILIRRKKKRLN